MIQIIFGILVWFLFLPSAFAQVSLQFHVQPREVPQGGMVQVVLDMTVSPGHHVFKDTLKLVLENPEGSYLDPLTAQPEHVFFDPFSKKERKTIEGQGSILSWLHIPNDTNQGERNYNFALTYQACSQKVCFFPKTVKFSTPLKITNAMGKVERGGHSLAGALEKGTFWAFLFVFIGGILASFTPCIFPMIPITISIIGARAADNKRSKSFALSVSYVLGIAVTYSTLGVIAASSGAFFGGILGNVYVVSVISLIFIAMGFSMLGFFHIQAPAFLRNKIGTKKTSAGFTGAFLAGLISGVVASPCIGPVLVGILTFVAQTAEVFFGFALLFTFALGLGLIFIVLGTFSGLLTSLPKAGKWMHYTKLIFGVVLIGMGIYYLKPFLPEIPQQRLTGNAKSIHPGIQWENYIESKVAEARTQGRPVIIDFSADWCVACHELDDRTYTDGQVQELSKKFVLLKIDATHITPDIEVLRKKYDVLGLPTVVFLGKNGEVLKNLTVTGFVEAPVFLDTMKKAL